MQSTQDAIGSCGQQGLAQFVTDAFGFVHDTAGLMVCDASLFPTPIGVNPMETIQALATRAAAHILDTPARLR